MSDGKKLTDKQLELLRPRFQGGETNPIGMLLDHIDAMDAEYDELVKASGNLIDEQDKRIKALKELLRRTLKPMMYSKPNPEETDQLIIEVEMELGIRDEQGKVIKANG